MQPPVVSTLSARGVWQAILATIRPGDRARQALQAALCTRFGAERAILTDSGTSALVLALRAAAPAGTVALPSYGCLDLVSAALRAGVRLRFYDVDPLTLSPALDSVAAVLRRGVDAIVVAHLFGYPANVPEVARLARPSGTRVIEDAAQAAGGRLHGRLLGSLGPLSVLSFGRGKGLAAGAGGALLVMKDAEAWPGAPTLLRPFAHAQDPSGLGGLATVVAAWLLGRPSFYAIPSSIPFLRLGESFFRPAHAPGRIGRASAALALDALGRASSEAEARRVTAGRLRSGLSGPGIRVCDPLEGSEAGFLRLPVLLSNAVAAPRLGVLRAYPFTLAARAEVAPMVLAGESVGPGSLQLCKGLHTVPVHQHVTEAAAAQLTRWAALPGFTVAENEKSPSVRNLP